MLNYEDRGAISSLSKLGEIASSPYVFLTLGLGRLTFASALRLKYAGKGACQASYTYIYGLSASVTLEAYALHGSS